MNDKETHKLFSELGYINKWLETIDRRLTEQNGHIASVSKKVQRHELFIGKVGAVTTFFAFAFSILVTALINLWFKLWRT